MVWTSLVRGRFKESLLVGEKDVAAAAQESGEASQAEAFEYKMQPIVLIVPRGSAPAAIEARRKEAEALRERVQTCEEANAFFKSMQNAAIRETVTKTSADIPAAAARTAGQDADRSSDPARGDQAGRRNGGAVRAGSRPPIDTPKKREIRDKMYAEKYEAKSKAYLDGCPQSRDDRISLMAWQSPSR